MLRVFRRMYSITPMLANNLADNPGARKSKKILGRGPGSGLGKTSGRGTKGHNSRSGGGVKPSFEGGQTGITKRIPKWGMTETAHLRPLREITFANIYYGISKGRIDSSKTITMKDLFEAGCFSRAINGVTISAYGAHLIDRPLHFEVTDASSDAIKAIKEMGGTIKLIHKTKIQLKKHLKPYKYDLPMNETAMPPPHKTLKLIEKGKNDDVEMIFKRPKWIEGWKPIEMPELPPHKKKKREKLVRYVEYGGKSN